MEPVPSFQHLLAEAVRDADGNASRHLNPKLLQLIAATGLDRRWVRGEGAWIEDDRGYRFIDCIGGFAVHSLGRRHPAVVSALHAALDSGHPGWVRFEANGLAALLAKRLSARMPADLPFAFFTNSGTEAVECALKLARRFTGRSAVLGCDRGFHGMTLGALAANGNAELRAGFGELGPAEIVPFNDLSALEAALSTRRFAAFLVEPVQGKTCMAADPGYLAEASRLCRAAGTQLVVDEVQTGVGRTGRFLAVEHDLGCVPDMVVMSKALSGGYVPVGVAMVRADVWRTTFGSMSRAFVHSSTLHEGTLAMTAALTVLEVHDAERLSVRAAEQGERLRAALQSSAVRHGLGGEVRGRGLMLGVPLGRSASERWLASLPGVGALEGLLFGQAFVMEMFGAHRVMTQVTGGRSDLLKFTPPLVCTPEQVDAVAAAFESTCARLATGPRAFVHGLARVAANLAT